MHVYTVGEARHRLGTLREELEVKQEENLLLQSKLLELSSEHSIQLSRNQQVIHNYYLNSN